MTGQIKSELAGPWCICVIDGDDAGKEVQSRSVSLEITYFTRNKHGSVCFLATVPTYRMTISHSMINKLGERRGWGERLRQTETMRDERRKKYHSQKEDVDEQIYR